MTYAFADKTRRGVALALAPERRRPSPQSHKATRQRLYGNQAAMRVLARRTVEPRATVLQAPAYIGDVDDGTPKLTPDGGTGAPAPVPAGDDRAAKAPSCTDICDRAYKDSTMNFGGGGVICDGTKKCACVFDVAPLKRGQCPDLDTDVLNHETGHLSDVDCDPKKGLHRPPFRDPSKVTASECDHRKASIAALEKAVAKATGDCKTGMTAIRDKLKFWVAANCA